MSYECAHSVFIHVAKCGGTALRRAFYLSELKGVERGNAHSPVTLALCWKPSRVDLHSWAVVREPCAWYRSFWCYRQAKPVGERPGHDIDALMSNNFGVWVDNCVTHEPGSYCRYLESMLGWPLRISQVIGMGNLLFDACSLLESIGEDFDREKFLSVPRMDSRIDQVEANDSSSLYERAVLSEEICAKIRKSEQLVYERFESLF